MNFLSLDELKKQTASIESKSFYNDDDTPNTVLESVNSVNNIVSKGRDINNEIDFSDLENAVNTLTECDNPELANKITERMKEPMKTNTPTPMPVKPTVKKPVAEASENPSKNVTSMDAFVNAKPVSQTDYVTAKTDGKVNSELNKNNTASNLDVTTHASDKSTEVQSEKTMNSMQSGADDNKKWADVATKQNVLKEKAVKYESFMNSLKTDSNKSLIESATKAFDLLIKKYL